MIGPQIAAIEREDEGGRVATYHFHRASPLELHPAIRIAGRGGRHEGPRGVVRRLSGGGGPPPGGKGRSVGGEAVRVLGRCCDAMRCDAMRARAVRRDRNRSEGEKGGEEGDARVRERVEGRGEKRGRREKS